MSSKSKYKVSIIGAGRIGCGFDASDSEQVLTHAHAAMLEPRTEIAAFVDADEKRGAAEAERWGAAFFRDIEKMFAETKPDIVVIATPDETHAEMLRQVFVLKPRLIICEKPVATTEQGAADLAGLRNDVPVIVNFSRRFDATTAEVARALAAGEYGAVISAHGTYVRGILHNGSHMFDLARNLFGELTEAKPLSALADFPGGAASVSGFARFERCSEFLLSHGDGRQYSLFELDILTEKRRIRFVDEGRFIEMQDAIDDPVYAGFRSLSSPIKKETELSRALINLYAHAANVLDGSEPPRSTLTDALKTQEACMRFAKGMETA